MTLLKLLRDEMTPTPILQPEMIGLASPADKGDLNLALFLYKIEENEHLRANQMVSKGTNLLQYPPMVVNLHYLMTAYSTAELPSRALDETRIMGRAMQVFFDHAIVRSPHLQGTLAENDEELRIIVDNLSTDLLLSSIWNFPDVPYRLSVSYIVGPVRIDSMRTKETTRVTERDIRINE